MSVLTVYIGLCLISFIGGAIVGCIVGYLFATSSTGKVE